MIQIPLLFKRGRTGPLDVSKLPASPTMSFDEYRERFPRDFNRALGIVLNHLRRRGVCSPMSLSNTHQVPQSAKKFMIDGEELWIEIAKHLVREKKASVFGDSSSDFAIVSIGR